MVNPRDIAEERSAEEYVALTEAVMTPVRTNWFTTERWTNTSWCSHKQIHRDAAMNKYIVMQLWTNTSWCSYEQIHRDAAMNNYIVMQPWTNTSWCSHEQLHCDAAMNKYIMMQLWTNTSWCSYEQIHHDAAMNKYIMMQLWTNTSWCSKSGSTDLLTMGRAVFKVAHVGQCFHLMLLTYLGEIWVTWSDAGLFFHSCNILSMRQTKNIHR